MLRIDGYAYGHWGRGMHRMRRPWRAGRWGYRRRPCCCLFFALPLMVLPFLVLAVFIAHAI